MAIIVLDSTEGLVGAVAIDHQAAMSPCLYWALGVMSAARLPDAVPANGCLIQVEAKARSFRGHQATIFQDRHIAQDSGRAGDILNHEGVGDSGQEVDVNF